MFSTRIQKCTYTMHDAIWPLNVGFFWIDRVASSFHSTYQRCSWIIIVLIILCRWNHNCRSQDQSREKGPKVQKINQSRLFPFIC